jgi:hypothetical protein
VALVVSGERMKGPMALGLALALTACGTTFCEVDRCLDAGGARRGRRPIAIRGNQDAPHPVRTAVMNEPLRS